VHPLISTQIQGGACHGNPTGDGSELTLTGVVEVTSNFRRKSQFLHIVTLALRVTEIPHMYVIDRCFSPIPVRIMLFLLIKLLFSSHRNESALPT
jgi:hypothetical protein